MQSIEFQYFKTKFGELKLAVYKDQLVVCDWRYRRKRNSLDAKISKNLNAEFIESKHPLIEEVQFQIQSFLEGNLKQFYLPIQMIGTDFQKSVWEELRKIEYGKTLSYSELAENMGNPKAIRAIATANGDNTLALIIPCHRIIGKNGDLVGYAGGLQTKQKLLELEGSLLPKNQLKLF